MYPRLAHEKETKGVFKAIAELFSMYMYFDSLYM